MAPAVLVVVRHAALGERHHLLERAGALRQLQREDAHQIGAAGIVHLVELVARAELGANRVPEQFHRLDALLVVDAVRAAHVLGQILVDVRVLEVAAWTFVPAAGAVLAEWGAEVIKVEPRDGGDPQRGLVTMGLVDPLER